MIICKGGQHRPALWHYLVVKMFDSDEIYSTDLIYWSMTLSICCQSLDNTTNSTLILQSVIEQKEVKNGDRPISKIYGLLSPGKSNLARRTVIVLSNMYENVKKLAQFFWDKNARSIQALIPFVDYSMVQLTWKKTKNIRTCTIDRRHHIYRNNKSRDLIPPCLTSRYTPGSERRRPVTF